MATQAAPKAMAHIQEGVVPLRRAFLDTPDGQIHYRMDGKGEPPLVLLHGTPRSSFEYHKMIPILAQKRRVIAMDTIGYGDSDKLPESKWYTIEDYAGTVVKLLDTLRIEKAVIVGCHSGSKMAVEVAAAYSKRTDRLVLLGAYFWEEAKWWTERGLVLADMWKEQELREDGSHLMDLWHQRALGMEFTDLKIKQRLFLDILRAEGMSHRGHWASANYPQEKRLPLIKCPTLVIWGSEDVRLHSEIGFHRRNLAESIPRCKVMEIQGGAFTLALQMPEQVSRTILEFLRDSNGESKNS